MEKIAVAGAGMMGAGIAQVFATRGHAVRIYARTPARLACVKDRVRHNLSRMSDYALVEPDTIPDILDRIALSTNLDDASHDADFVFESITEDLAMKQELFAELDRMAPREATLCSNSSALSITAIASHSTHRGRILGTHFFQPPFLLPLVEVVRAAETCDENFEKTFALLRDAGRMPVRVHKDIPGFLGNRLQHAMIREAFSLIDEGVCDPETIDIVINNSFGMRMPVLGPVTHADLVGLDLTLAVQNRLLPHLSVSTTPSATLRSHIEHDELGFKTRRGFLQWTDESVAEVSERLMTYLLESLKWKATRDLRRHDEIEG